MVSSQFQDFRSISSSPPPPQHQQQFIIKKNMPNLPPDILVDILSRLPVKSLLRFRCVSRWCRDLIDSKDFVKMHFNQSILASSNLNLILGFLGIYYVDMDSLDSAVPLKPPFSSSDVSNSCNGLVLILMGPKQSPYLWNPFTRKYKTLPDSLVDYPQGSVAADTLYTRYAFGYDSQADDYKVLRAVEFRGPDFNWIGTEAKLYSLRSNSWRKMPDFPCRIPRTREWAVHLNGALHTIVINESGQSILAFDLRSEKTYVVPRPEKLVPLGDLRLHSLGGSLCLISPFKKHRIEVWIMKEYNVKESWTKLFSIAPPTVEPHTILCPVAFSKNGDEILLNLNEEKLVWYDLRRKTTRDVSIQGLPFRFYADVCVETLISPDLEDGGNEIKKKPPIRRDKRNVKIGRKRNDFLSEGFKLVL